MNPDTMLNDGKHPTITEIAKRCGVSRSTVSRALNSIPGMQTEETRERILKVAQEMGYDPMYFHSARQLVSVRDGRDVLNHIMALLFFQANFSKSNYFFRVFQGVLDGVLDTDFEILNTDLKRISYSEELPLAFRRGDIDGLLVIEQDNPEWQRNRSKLRGLPRFGNRPIVGLVSHLDGCSAVYPDGYASGQVCITHLLELGHRHVMMFHKFQTGSTSVFDQRNAAYADAYRQIGLDAADYLHECYWNDTDDATVERSSRVIIDFLGQHPKITAIIARQDQQAVKVHKALVQAGLRVPQDISLIGYDDTDAILDGRGNNILTTTRNPLTEVGKQGAQLLMRRILGVETEDRDIVLPVELVVRNSTMQPDLHRRQALAQR